MRILIMVHSLTGGGAERVAALWAKGFVERGYEVGMVLSCSENTPITYKVPDTIKIYRLNSWLANKLHRKLGFDYYYVWNLSRVVKDFQPDVIIGVMQPWTEWARKATRGMNIPIVNTEHNSFERPESAPMSKRRMKEKYVWNKRYHQVTVLNNADKICTEGKLNNVTVLPNPLAFIPAKHLPKKENVVLAAGRLTDWHYKGFDILIKVWGQVAPVFPNWRLEIAGKGSQKDEEILLKMMEEEGLSQSVTLLGYQEDMLPIYQRSSIFMLTSRYEGFGMVLIEAMSQGCAPIVCDYKGRQHEIITDSSEGVLCEPENIEVLVKALTKMISDDDYRKGVEHGAIERSKDFCLDKIIDRWKEIFNKLGI